MTTNNFLIGCMRMKTNNYWDFETGDPKEKVDEFITKLLDNGLNIFDHADVYGGGECEKIFGDSIKRLGIPRDKYYLQSKVGVDKRNEKTIFNQDKNYILEMTDKCLERLGVEYLDSLLLHRPDPLFDPIEVGEALQELKNSGKVKTFGVSNFTPQQLDLLLKFSGIDIDYNQIQFSAAFHPGIDQTLVSNTLQNASLSRDLGIIDYCRLHSIEIQAWSPFQFGYFGGTFIDNDKFPELNLVLEKLANKYSVSKTTIAASFILRHPGKIKIVTGSMNIDRLLEIKQAENIELERYEWNEILFASGTKTP